MFEATVCHQEAVLWWRIWWTVWCCHGLRCLYFTLLLQYFIYLNFLTSGEIENSVCSTHWAKVCRIRYWIQYFASIKLVLTCYWLEQHKRDQGGEESAEGESDGRKEMMRDAAGLCILTTSWQPYLHSFMSLLYSDDSFCISQTPVLRMRRGL